MANSSSTASAFQSQSQSHHSTATTYAVYVSGLDPLADEELLFELFSVAGPVVNVKIVKNTSTLQPSTQNANSSAAPLVPLNYCFVDFAGSDSADYACALLNQIRLFGRPIKVSRAGRDRLETESKARLFIGSLAPTIDERLLFQYFSPFGSILSTKLVLDNETGASRGFGFVLFDEFESADKAIQAMNGQWIENQQINVQYAMKKDGKPGEIHGSEAERELEKRKKLIQTNNNSKIQNNQIKEENMKKQPQHNYQQQQNQYQQQNNNYNQNNHHHHMNNSHHQYQRRNPMVESQQKQPIPYYHPQQQNYNTMQYQPTQYQSQQQQQQPQYYQPPPQQYYQPAMNLNLTPTANMNPINPYQTTHHHHPNRPMPQSNPNANPNMNHQQSYPRHQ